MRKHLRALRLAASFLALAPIASPEIALAYNPGVPQTSTQLQNRTPGLFEFDNREQFLRDMIASMASGNGVGATSLAASGAKCDGATDDSNAALAAEAQAELVGGGVYVPPGQTCIIRTSLDMKVPWFSLGQAPTLKWDTDLGAGTFAAILEDGDVISLMNLRFLGPGGNNFPGPGNSPNGVQMDGVEIGKTANTAPQPHLNSLDLRGWHNALTINSNFGHILIDGHTTMTNDYVGIEFKASGGDFKMVGAELTGFGMAAISMAGGSLAGGCYIGYTHLGFAPYAMLVEPGASTGSPMDSCTFDETHFESIGNSVLSVQTPAYSVITSTKFHHTGFIWDAPGLNGSNWSYTLGGAATPPTVTTTCTPINGSRVMSCSGNPQSAGFAYTMGITGSGIANNTFVAAVTSNSITLSQNASSSPGAVTVSGAYHRLALDLAGADLEGILDIDTGTYPFMVNAAGQLIHLGYCGANGFAGKVRLHYDGPYKQFTSQIDGSQAFVNVLPQSTSAPALMAIDNDQGGCMANSRIITPFAAEGSITLRGANVDPSYSSVATDADSWSSTTHNSGLNYFEVAVVNPSNIQKDNVICLVPSATGNTTEVDNVANNACVDLVGDVFVNAVYVGTHSAGPNAGNVWRIATDQTHNKWWYEVLYQGAVVGTGWDGNGTDNPSTNTGGFALTAATTYKAGLGVDTQLNGTPATNGAFAFNFAGPWAPGGGLPTGFSAWGGTLNSGDTAGAITLPAGDTSQTTSFLLDLFAFSIFGLNPVCAPQQDPGSRWWMTPLVATLSNQITAQVNLQSAPVNDVTFDCSWTRH